jgi:hypothetical protein
MDPRVAVFGLNVGALVGRTGINQSRVGRPKILHTTDGLLGILRFHAQQLNPDRIGHGRDAHLTGKADHPMAYGIYARGLVALARAGGEDWPLEIAERALAVLQQHVTHERRVAWGLGFGHGANDPSTLYAITTAICGHAFLDYALAADAERFIETAISAGEWLVSDLPWSLEPVGAAPWYAPGHSLLAPNVAAKVGAFLGELYAVTGTATFKVHAVRATAFLLHRQDRAGFWTYGRHWARSRGYVRPSQVIDTVHSAYVLEGLARLSTLATGAARAAVTRCVQSGWRFVRESMVVRDGRIIEKVVVVDSEDPRSAPLLRNPRLPQRSLNDGRVIVAFPAESRAWGYGAALGAAATAMARAVPIGEPLAATEAYLWHRYLRRPVGRFPYNASDARSFPRHEAHLLEGLARLAAQRRVATMDTVP